MKKIILPIIFVLLCKGLFAQTIANVESVFGGSINAINGGFITSQQDSFRIIVATQSANSIFYSKAYVPHFGGNSTIDSFRVLPAASSSAGFGSGITKIAYHFNSSTVFFIATGNIYSASLTASSATKITSNSGYTDIVIKGDNIYAMTSQGSNNTFYKGSINSSGTATFASNATIVGGAYTQLIIGKNDKLFAFREGTDPQAVMFGGTNASGINLSSTSIDALATLNSSIIWGAFNVYTDGTVFVGGNNTGKVMAKASAFNGSYTLITTGINGKSGYNIEFKTINATSYYVYFGSAYSNNNGNNGTWFNLGNVSFETHPNDGQVYFVADNPGTGGVLLLTTDQGIGVTKNSGSVITEVDNGINAVQVKDFDMNSSKDFGWLASKSGIRYVDNYNTSSKSWSKALFPNGDGSPYYAVEMVDKDTAYVGNTRVYKTKDRGNTWTQLYDGGSGVVNNFSSLNAHVSSIAIGGTNNAMIMVGYKVEIGISKGGVIYSTNHGQTFNQLFINTSSFGSDVNVNDIEITMDNGRVTAYIGVDYDNTKSPIVKGMYKAVWNGSSWAVTNETLYSATSALYSIKDINIVSKDTLLAVGSFYNTSLNKEYPIYFAKSKPTMNSWSSSVVDTNRNNYYSATSWNKDTIFYAYSNKIYYDVLGFYSSYITRQGEYLYYSVPVGTDVNVLFYDELLAGTETDIRSVKGATVKRPTSTTSIRNGRISGCADGVISGGNPSGGVYYLVDTTVVGYLVEVDSLFYVLLASNGILTGDRTMAFTSQAAASAAFAGSSLATFTTLTTYPSSAGTFVIAYTTDSYALSSTYAIATTTAGPTIPSITGTTTSCGPMNATSYLTNSYAGGTWASSDSNIATINSTGLVTVKGIGTSTISYGVAYGGGCTAYSVTNFTVAGVPYLANITGNNSLCVGSTVQLSDSTTGGVWSSLNNRASVDTNGLVTGLSGGSQAQIRYTKTNSSGCSSSRNFFIMVNSLPTTPSIAYADGTRNPRQGVGGTYCNGRSFTVIGTPTGGKWSSSNPSVMTVTSGGYISLLGMGTATLSYTYTNGNGCKSIKQISGSITNCPSGKGLFPDVADDGIQVNIYPNPAKNFVQLLVNNVVGSSSVSITDYLGRTLKQQPLSLGTNTIDIKDLKSGNYIIYINTNNKIKVERLVKE